MDNNSGGLIGDPKRQAIPALRGFAYQIWQSVYKWVTLEEDEILFLEGAEDVDVLGPGNAETIQIKDLQKTVTLRSNEILEAMAHFWEHQNKNPERRIIFRFLTTAERGKEVKNPFGDKPGLDYWDDCKRAATNLAPLRDFLKSNENLPKELYDFVDGADDDLLRDRLIRRIEWDTGRQPKEFIEALINKEVSYYGIRLSLHPTESEKVIPHLLKHVWDVVCRENETDRRLEYYDFMRVFENASQVLVSKFEFQRLQQMVAYSSNIQSGTLTQFPSKFATSESFSDIQLTTTFESPSFIPLERLAKREGFVNKLNDALNAKGIITLKGSTGMGKSILARFVTKVDSRSHWRWIHMREIKAEQIGERLYHEAVLYSHDSLNKNIVIDDLNFSEQSYLFENAFASLFHAVMSRNGRIIITTQGEIPSRIALLANLSSDSVIEVPPLEENEIEQLAVNHECPNEHLEMWTKIINGTTQGHPQLAHARVRNLQEIGWSIPKDLDSIFGTQSLEKVRKDARNLLRDQLPSKDAKTLAYTLSTLGQPFRRDHVLLLATKTSSINHPGEVFDRLVGPWIERVTDQYYRLSPLLDGAAKEIWPAQKLKELHKATAETLLECKRISMLEVSGILLHGLLGQATGPLIATINSIVITKKNLPSRIYQELIWLTAFGLEHNQKLFPSNNFVSVCLRMLQFRIAAEADSETAVRIASAWEDEISSIEQPEFKSAARLMFILETLIRFQVPFSQKTIISRIIEATHAIKYARKLFPNVEIMHFAIARCDTTKNFEEFVSAIEEQPSKIQRKLLSQLNGDDGYVGQLLISTIYRKADTQPSEGAKFITACKKMIDLSSFLRLNSLIAALYRAIAVVQGEFLNDKNTALSTLDECQGDLRQKHPVIEDYRATILFQQKKFDDAFSIWQIILPNWHKGIDSARALSYRYAEICAAQLGDWVNASEMALMGEEIAKQGQHIGFSVMAIGFHADYAFALWKLGNKLDAIESFAKVIDAFKTLPEPQKDLLSYTLQKRIGHAIGWLRSPTGVGSELAEPMPGCFSNLDVDERIKEYPIVPSVLLWYQLAEIEFEIQSGEKYFERVDKECGKFSLPALEFNLNLLRIKRHLRNLELSNLVVAFQKFAISYEAYAKHDKIGKKPYEEGNLVPDELERDILLRNADNFINLLFTALVILVNRGDPFSNQIKQWRGDTRKLGLINEVIEEWFDFAEQCLQKSLSQLLQTMKDKQAKAGIRLVCALLISSQESVMPNDCFYANILIVNWQPHLICYREIENEIEVMISTSWRRIATGQRFAILHPNINAPAILNACDDASHGFKKTAKILLTAKDAVGMSVPNEMLRQLRNLAES